MSQTLATPPVPPDPPQPSVPPVGGAWANLHITAVWLAVLILCGLIIWPSHETEEESGEPSPATPSLEALVLGRIVVGTNHLLPQYGPLFLAGVSKPSEGPFVDRMCHVVLIGEVSGPQDALAALKKPNSRDSNEQADDTSDPADLNLVEILTRLYEDRAAGRNELPSVPDDDRSALRKRLEWFGELALLHAQTSDADRRQAILHRADLVPIAMAGYLCWIGVWGLSGYVAVVTFLVLAFQRRLQHGFRESSGRGVIYLETFALWLLLFVGARWLASLWEPKQGGVLIFAAVDLVSLVVLLWPLVRGVSGAQMRQDIGLWMSPRPGREILAGLMSYAMALPIAGLGLIVTLGLLALQKSLQPGAAPPSHPAQQMMVGADWWTAVQLLLLGSVVAPLVEETMFRGLLYRHLRELTGRWGMVLSMLASASISSVLFAAIHPQGWTFIPVLSALAVAFCIAREWRGSLLPGMIAHGLTNAAQLSLGIALLSGG